MKLGPGGGSRVQGTSRTAFVGDQMTHGGQKGFGMTRHGRSGHATRLPVPVSCRSSKHRRTIARTALGSRTRNSPSKSYCIPGSQHEPDEIPKQQARTPSSKQVCGRAGVARRPSRLRQCQRDCVRHGAGGASVVKKTPVVAGVNGTDPLVTMETLDALLLPNAFGSIVRRIADPTGRFKLEFMWRSPRVRSKLRRGGRGPVHATSLRNLLFDQPQESGVACPRNHRYRHSGSESCRSFLVPRLSNGLCFDPSEDRTQFAV